MTPQKAIINGIACVVDSGAPTVPITNLSEDGGDIVAYNAAVLKARTVISVKEPRFGAAGDDITDDTIAIGLADTEAAARGATVYFPEGTYKITASLAPSSSVEWVGAGWGKSIIKGASGWSAGQPLVLIDTKTRVIVKNLRFELPSNVLATTGVRINTSTDCHVIQCAFDAHLSWSVFIGVGSSGCGADRIISEGTCESHNVEINTSSYNYVTNSTLKSSTGNGVEIYHTGAATTTRGNRIIGNYIQGSGASGIATLGDVQSIISDNVIVGSVNLGIRSTVSETDAAVVPIGCTISGNSVINCGVSAGVPGIQVDSGIGTTITGNTIRGSGTQGLTVSAARTTISGNAVKESGTGGIYIGGGSHVVSSNIVLDNSTSGSGAADGISLASGAVNCVITNNQCSDTRAPKLQRYGILLQSGANNNIVLGNDLTNNLTGRYLDSGTGNMRLLAEDFGAAATPAYSFFGDPDTGMYRVNTNRLGFATNGTLSFEVLSDQRVSLHSDFVLDDGIRIDFNGKMRIYSPDANMYFRDNANSRMHATFVPGASNSAADTQLASKLTMGDGSNIVLGTSTGTVIGTATGQKIAFHNSTPVIQRASSAQAAVASTAATITTPYGYTTQAQADALVTLVNEIRAALVEKGIIKGSA